MKHIEWIDGNRIKIDRPRRTKKVTGTRFASILGLNPWSTEFEMWCAITKTYEIPFEDTKYTLAGKTIEPKQAEYMERSYAMDLMSPADKFGDDYFNATRGDFFWDSVIFGGMWDYLRVDENRSIDAVLEMKTTKRIEDWEDDIPEYYALQAALYAYLLGVDDVIMVASFLKDADYSHPEKYKPTFENTITREFKVSERYPDFYKMIAYVHDWWDRYVETGISPPYDEKKDAEILKALRTNSLSPDTEIKDLVEEAEQLKAELDTEKAKVADKEKRLKKCNDLIKEYAQTQFGEGENKVEISGTSYKWILSRSEKEKVKIDEDALKADGLFEKYAEVTTDTAYRLTVKEI